MMKNTLCLFMMLLALAGSAYAQEKMSLWDITAGTYVAENLKSLQPLADGASFAQISQNSDKILKYAFATGEQTGVIFDAALIDYASIDDYKASPDDRYLLIGTNSKRIYRRSFSAEYYLYDTQTRAVRKLSANGAQQVPVWSPDSRRVAFVRDNNIFIVEIGDELTETQVTTDGKFNYIINGIPDWVNEEEFGFNTALAFTADSRNLAWIKYDESGVKTYALQLFKGLKPEREELEVYPGGYAYKYPKAGEDNAVVSAWTYDISQRTTRQIALPLNADGYIPRILPGVGTNDVLLYTMNRHQDTLKVYSASNATLQCRLLITESVPCYVKEEAMEGITVTSKHILVPSDRDGTMQVYLYDLDGRLLRKMTDARYGVDAVYGYDERSQSLYYQAAGRSPMQREVYVTNNKGKTRLLTPREGWNRALFSADYAYYIATFSNAQTPFECAVFNAKGKELRKVVDNAKLRGKLADLALATKEFFSFTTSEGVTLNGWMMKPHDFDASRKYPVIMHQYSGPGSQQVVDSWGIGSMGQGGAYDQYLTEQGFIIVCVDGRGTGARGAEFEKCTYLKLGELEARDQVETAIYLSTLSYVDSLNIGIWGWSYGGFCTLMSMSEGRGVFKAGVAVAPPTNWRYYDSVYTERFMRTPQENPDGYAVNPIVRASQLHGALLVCHGLADDNVHPQNTFEYSEALVQANKDFRELIYTNRNHSIYGGNTRYHLLRQIAQFFERELKGN